MLVNYQKEDYIQVLVLWQEAFGDTKEDIDACLALFSQYLYVCKEKDTVISMLMRLPLTCGDKKGEYIYAVATKKEARGHGLATKMLEEVQSRVQNHIIDFLVLVPANASLFDFYKKRGFTAGTPLTTITAKNSVAPSTITIRRCTPAVYGALRQKYFSRLSAWDTQMLTNIEMLYGDCYYELLSESGHGFCMAYMQKDTLTISELCLYAIDSNDALSVLCAHFGTAKATAKIPSSSGEPFAMFYPQAYTDLYFNLAIN